MEEVCLGIPLIAKELHAQGYQVTYDNSTMAVSDPIMPGSMVRIYAYGASVIGCNLFEWVDLHESGSIEKFMIMFKRCAGSYCTSSTCPLDEE